MQKLVYNHLSGLEKSTPDYPKSYRLSAKKDKKKVIRSTGIKTRLSLIIRFLLIVSFRLRSSKNIHIIEEITKKAI